MKVPSLSEKPSPLWLHTLQISGGRFKNIHYIIFKHEEGLIYVILMRFLPAESVV